MELLMPVEIVDPYFGPLRSAGADWVGRIATRTFGTSVRVDIDSSDGPKEMLNPPSEAQRNAVRSFLEHEVAVRERIESALLEDYARAWDWANEEPPGVRPDGFENLPAPTDGAAVLSRYTLQQLRVPNQSELEDGDPGPSLVFEYVLDWTEECGVEVTVVENSEVCVQAYLPEG